MAVQVLDSLRTALEGLDQAIDRLETRIVTLVDDAGDGVVAEGAPHPAAAIVAERLDKMIGRIELALTRTI